VITSCAIVRMRLSKGASEAFAAIIDVIPTLAWSASLGGSTTFLNRAGSTAPGTSAKPALDRGWKATMPYQSSTKVELTPCAEWLIVFLVLEK